jgi:hypothetical protein
MEERDRQQRSEVRVRPIEKLPFESIYGRTAANQLIADLNDARWIGSTGRGAVIRDNHADRPGWIDLGPPLKREALVLEPAL